ncbi:MAG: GC-type dockerin domain-anchored protein [Phycisphaerales bacterium]
MSIQHTIVALSACSLLASAAGADTIVGDLTWHTGETIAVTENLVIQGTLHVEPGVTVNVSPGVSIIVQSGGVLDVDASEAQMSVFQPTSSRWNGIRFEPGSDGSLAYAAIHGTQAQAVRVIGATPEFDHCEISDVRSASQEQPAYGVYATDNANISVAWSKIFNIIGATGNDGAGGAGGTIVGNANDGNSGHLDGYNGADGGNGGPGGNGKRGADAVAIRMTTGATATVSYCTFSDLAAGKGGAGGFGGSGSRGGDGGNGYAFVAVGDGGDGGDGGNAGAAGNGGAGGYAAGVWASDPTAQVRVYQNLFHGIVGGAGGKGGRGGYGAQGGGGGNGADTGITFVCGGNGGDGGYCGHDTNGGVGGAAGWANAFVVENAPVRAIFSQNTVADIVPGDRGDRGDRVNNTTPSYGGYGGTGGWPNYCEGDDGSGHARPNDGANGPYGAYANSAALMASSAAAGVQAQAINNIFSIGTPVDGFSFVANGSAIIASDSNLFDTAAQEDYFTGAGTTSLGFAFVLGDPMFADAPAGDYRITAGSPAIDAGDSFNVTSLGMTVDLDGNARIVDDPDAPNLALYEPIDMGAYEFTMQPDCAADLAEPLGTLDFSDVLAFLTAFGSMGAAADLAAPFGTYDFSDVLAFLTAFGAGCP